MEILNRQIHIGAARPPRWVLVPVAAGGAAVGAAIGALSEFLLDPDAGKRRRHTIQDKALEVVRRGQREAPADDVTLASKVESTVFRQTGVPKDAVNVDAHDGTVVLRGEVPSPEQIGALVDAAVNVDGVQRVENLLRAAA
jgi:BON domain